MQQTHAAMDILQGSIIWKQSDQETRKDSLTRRVHEAVSDTAASAWSWTETRVPKSRESWVGFRVEGLGFKIASIVWIRLLGDCRSGAAEFSSIPCPQLNLEPTRVLSELERMPVVPPRLLP